MSKKLEVYRLLEKKDYDQLLAFFDREPNTMRKYLTMLTYHDDESIRRQGIDFFGFLAKKRAANKPEYFRETIRRHLWGMNDESGNMDWSAPEIIAHIVVAEPDLFGEFASIMIEAALREPVFQPSLKNAMKIIAAQNRKLIEYHLNKYPELLR